MQRSLDERLGRRLVEIDSSLQRVRIDTHASVVGLRDVAASVARLEAKLDRIERAVNRGEAVNRGDGGRTAQLLPEARSNVAGHIGVWHLSEDSFYGRQDLPDERADGDFDLENHMADQHLPPGETLQDVNKKLEWIAQKLEQVLDSRVKREDSTQDIKPSKGGPLNTDKMGKAAFDLTRQTEVQHQVDMLQNVDRKVEGMSKMLDLMSGALGVKMGVANVGDDAEDRKRLKEKLKDAVEKDKRDRFRKIESEQEVWLEYIFGICKSDLRTGKHGSRCYDVGFLSKKIFFCIDRLFSDYF